MTVLPSPVPKPKAKVVLAPLNLHNKDEFDELLRQRILCGWASRPAHLEAWRAASDRAHKFLFWIHLPPPSETRSANTGSPAQNAPAGQGHQRIGHIGFQSVPDIGEPDSDLELVNTDKSVLMIASFFILEEYRGGRVGAAAMEALEAMTRVPPYGSPDCHALTLHTMSRRYVEDEGDGSPDAWMRSRGVWQKLGAQPRRKEHCAELWYSRMGYVKWKEEPRYEETTVDGQEFKLIASFMRKPL